MKYSSDLSLTLPVNKNKKARQRKISDIKRICVHTTDWDTSVATVANYDIGPNHIDKTGCPTVTYHDFVMKNGDVVHALDYTNITWSVGVWNPGTLAVALMYRCSDKEGKDVFGPTEEAMRALRNHLTELCLRLKLTPDAIVGHRELQFTGWTLFKGSKVLRKTCPGMKVDLDALRTDVAKSMQSSLKLAGLYTGPIDGIFGKGSLAALQKYDPH